MNTSTDNAARTKNGFALHASMDKATKALICGLDETVGLKYKSGCAFIEGGVAHLDSLRVFTVKGQKYFQRQVPGSYWAKIHGCKWVEITG